MSTVVLFDLDGTLMDSAPGLALAANHLRVLHELPELPYKALRPVASQGTRGLLGVALDLAPDHILYPYFQTQFLSHYRKVMIDNTRFFDGIEALLQALDEQGITWGIVTNKSEALTFPLLEAFGLVERSAVTICGDTTAHIKPHPEPLLEASRRLKIAPEQCIYLGDDARDIEAAKAAGMRSVALSYGYSLDINSAQACQPDAIVQQPTAILSSIKQWIVKQN